MNLAQALKQKNRLAGELVRLQKILQRENARRSDNPSKTDRAAIWESIERASDELGKLKALIARANVPIYPQIERMAELKSRIAFIENLEKREGEEISYFGPNNEKILYKWESFLNSERSDDLISQIQKQINALQDEVDTFNAITQLT
jgi:hypothetical protein